MLTPLAGDKDGQTAENLKECSSPQSVERDPNETFPLDYNGRIIESTIPYGFWQSNSDGKMIYVSQSFLELVGLTLDEVRELSIPELFFVDEQKEFRRAWKKSSKSGALWEKEYRIIDKAGIHHTILNRGRPVRDLKGTIVCWVGINLDITERKVIEKELNTLRWLFTKEYAPVTGNLFRAQPYGDISESNTNGEILKSCGRELLFDIVSDYLDLLDTSTMVFEKDGSYALGICTSHWCNHLDKTSRALCQTGDNKEAMLSESWHCHRSCWGIIEHAINTRAPADKACAGGISIFAVPIMLNDEALGGIGFSYGNPPRKQGLLNDISKRYGIPIDKLKQLAAQYEPRPPFIIDLAKNRLNASARLISTLVKQRRALEDEMKERAKAEHELLQRHDALEAVYAIATALSTTTENIYDQIVVSIANILATPYASVALVEKHEFKFVSTFFKDNLSHAHGVSLNTNPCGIALHHRSTCQIHGDDLLQYQGYLSAYSGLASYAGIPLVNLKGEPLAVICVIDEKARHFTDFELHLIEIFGRYLTHEIERSHMERQLMNAQQMKMLGQLTSGVAHEVRNPLNAIISITEALALDLGEDKNYRPFIKHIRDQVTRLADLMSDLLDLGRPIESTNLQPISMVAILSSALDSWKGSSKFAHRPVTIKSLQQELQEVQILADKSKMQQVFVNLLDNACAHSPEGSEIAITMANGYEKNIIVEVTDQGSGIAQEHRVHLFEPFFTTRKGGTGLGLCIVKRIIESHNGSIEIYNNTDAPGVTVEIRLPVTPAMCAT